MCLLVVLSRVVPGMPLIVAANRDERHDRPSVPITALRDAAPRILGGRDGLAGGTWLAVNEYGVVAGLTNRPTAAGRDAAKRSRGELPVALAGHRSAAGAVEDFTAHFRPADYNPCWLLVGDRTAVFYVDMTTPDVPFVVALPPGVHVLENSPIDAPTPKSSSVRIRGTNAGRLPAGAVVDRLASLLGDHTVPPLAVEAPRPWPESANSQSASSLESASSPESASPESGESPPRIRPPQLSACCVHTEGYGTRSAALITVPSTDALPDIRVASGPPCVTRFEDANAWWWASQARSVG